MSETIIIIIASIIFGIIGFLIGKHISKLQSTSELSGVTERNSILEKQVGDAKDSAIAESKKLEDNFTGQLNSLKEQLNKSDQDKEFIRKQKDEVTIELTKLDADFKNLQLKNDEQKEEVTQLQEKFTKEFENLANKILDEKANKFTELNRENIKSILNPLQEKIQHFEKKVEDTHKESIGQHASLKEQILGLKDLNQQMSKETLNLTKALKGDSKLQGNWGELVLERVLEKSGLEKGSEYFVQQSFTNEEGNRVLPDVVIHLPENKKMIVDSKVSLTHYERYVNEEDTALQQQYLKEHVNSIKRHVEQLGEKNYHDLYKIESPDFVLLFIPIEPAFAVALNEDNSLYNKAFEKNIVIVTPTTLLATLRTIDTMWNNEKQQKNALEIATQAGRLYDQFVNLTNDFIKVGNQLKTVQGTYDGTMKKLTGKGNLIKKVENLKTLGIKQQKHFNDKLLERAIDTEQE